MSIVVSVAVCAFCPGLSVRWAGGGVWSGLGSDCLSVVPAASCWIVGGCGCVQW